MHKSNVTNCFPSPRFDSGLTPKHFLPTLRRVLKGVCINTKETPCPAYIVDHRCISSCFQQQLNHLLVIESSSHVESSIPCLQVRKQKQPCYTTALGLTLQKSPLPFLTDAQRSENLHLLMQHLSLNKAWPINQRWEDGARRGQGATSAWL